MAQQPKKNKTKYYPGDRTADCPNGRYRSGKGRITECGGGGCPLKGDANRWRVALGGTDTVPSPHRAIRSFTTDAAAIAYMNSVNLETRTWKWVFVEDRPAGVITPNRVRTTDEVFYESIRHKRTLSKDDGSRAVSEDSLAEYCKTYERHVQPIIGQDPIDQVADDVLADLYRRLWKDPAKVATGELTGALSRNSIKNRAPA